MWAQPGQEDPPMDSNDRQKGARMILVIGGTFQGKKEFAKALAAEKKLRVVNFFHNQIQELLEAGENVDEYIRRFLEKNPRTVIVMDEVGAGVVPVERSDREYREAIGLAGQHLAREAEEVYRVVCGIGMRIK